MKKTKDLTSVYIAILALVVIVVVFFLAYLSKMSKMPKQAEGTQNSQSVMNGQQTATITILPPGSVSTPTNDLLSHKLTETQQGVQSHMTMAENSGSIPANARVKFKISSFKKLALQPLEFEVFDESGKAYTPKELKVVHDYPLHFVVVSANLREFQHLHPTFEGGKWKVLANLPNPGTYYAYVDIAPVSGEPVVLRSNLIVQKETTDTINYPGLTPDLFALTKGYKAQLALGQAVVLQQSVLGFNLSKDGKAVELQPYLGALGHVIVFRHGNVDSYTHVHPLNSSDAKNGKAEFMTTFVKGGRYTAFAEFKLGSKVYTFPITFDING
ncbi:MAG: hypothetical protein U0519_00875 [Candidatus Gracilibacteria bacterium]